MASKRPVIIRVSIHGNIGVGKTTFMCAAEKLFSESGTADVRVVCVTEPTDAWNSSGMLRMVIHDADTWGVSVQYGMLLTRCTYAAKLEQDLVEPALQTTRKRVLVVLYERSLDDDREIFARHAIADPVKWKLYQDLIGTVDTSCYASICRMIYLHDTVSVCMDHIKERGRPGEDGYTEEWIAELDRRHDAMISTAKDAGTDVQCVPFPEQAHLNQALIRRVIMDAVETYAKA